MSRVRLGVVGLRDIGKYHIRNARACDDAEVVAIADINTERLCEVGDEFEINRRYYQPEKLFAQTDVDAVVLAVPVPRHASLAMQALKMGKHVLVEKPMARDPVEGAHMITAQRKAQKVLMVSTNQRFDTHIHGLKRAISMRVIGDPLLLKTTWSFQRPPDSLWARGDWFLSNELSGGGPMLDLGYHKTDLAMYLLDFPAIESVSGMCSYGVGTRVADRRGKVYTCEDTAIGFIKTRGKGVIIVEASYFLNHIHNSVHETWIHGTLGGVQNFMNQELVPYAVCDDMPPALEETATPLEKFSGMLWEQSLKDYSVGPTDPTSHFCKVILGKEELISTPEQGVTVLRIIEAIYNSARSGKQIDFVK